MDVFYGWGDSHWGLELVTPIVLVGAGVLISAVALRVFRAVPRALSAAVGVTWIMWLTIAYFTPRPVLFSLVFLAVFLLASDSPSLRWTLPPLIWAWAAVHGGFVVGLGYLFLDACRKRNRGRVWDLAICTFVTLLTAHGWGTWEIVLDFVKNRDALNLISEWLTPNFISFALFPFAIGLIALISGAISGRVRYQDLWVIVPFLLFALTANRSVPIAALVLAPLFVEPLGRMPIRDTTEKAHQSIANSVILSLILVFAWLVPLKGGLKPDLFAVEALGYVNEGRLFHNDAIGGYLIYSQWPERRVYIDDRAELYGQRFIEFVQARDGSSNWKKVFQEFKIHQALLELDDPLTEILTASGWTETYRDNDFIVLTDSTQEGISSAD
jgi:hypothetical protein